MAEMAAKKAATEKYKDGDDVPRKNVSLESRVAALEARAGIGPGSGVFDAPPATAADDDEGGE